MFILFIRRTFYYCYSILILARVEIRVFQKTFITRLMILLSLFEDYFIIIILCSIYYRYSTLILLSLFDFNFRENRNSYFVKIFSLCVRKSHCCYSIFIMRLIILLSLFDAYFNYLTFISLSLFDFNFRESSNSCFSHIFIVRSIISLLLFDDYFIYLTLDV